LHQIAADRSHLSPRLAPDAASPADAADGRNYAAANMHTFGKQLESQLMKSMRAQSIQPDTVYHQLCTIT
jgi:hypothetical protein